MFDHEDDCDGCGILAARRRRRPAPAVPHPASCSCNDCVPF